VSLISSIFCYISSLLTIRRINSLLRYLLWLLISGVLRVYLLNDIAKVKQTMPTSK